MKTSVETLLSDSSHLAFGVSETSTCTHVFNNLKTQKHNFQDLVNLQKINSFMYIISHLVI